MGNADDSIGPRWAEFSEGFRSSPELTQQSAEATNEVEAFHHSDGVVCVLKRYRSPRAYRREKRALQDWAPKLDVLCPRVLGSFPLDGPALLMSKIPGSCVSQSFVDPWLVSEQAGRALRQLHDLNIEDVDTLDPRDAVSERLDDALRRSASWLNSAERLFLEQVLRELPQLPPRQRVVCHGDYVHRNWLWCQDSAQLGVLDFENSRLDIAEFDFLKLHMELWCQKPDSRNAFFEGYGAFWAPGNQIWIETIEALYRLGTVNWMRQSGHASELAKAQREFAALARGRG